jgi:hypothetical protein
MISSSLIVFDASLCYTTNDTAQRSPELVRVC